MANHLTPMELADQRDMEPDEVVAKCHEMGVPILNGRIDKFLFSLSLQAMEESKQEPAKH